MTRVSVVGLGKLGASMAACFAAKGFDVIGVDVNPRTIDLVNSGQAPVFEPGLPELMARARGRLSATGDYAQAVQVSEATFIIVPTPSEDHGGFSLKYVRQAAQKIGRALKNKSGYHLVVLSSTVLPGSTELGVKPFLEEASGKKCGKDFGLCYSPEFIALGSVIRDFLNPDFALIGESDPAAGDQLAAIYAALFDNHPPMARMNLVNAELTKIALNTYVTAKISFANMLAEVCERLPGGDVDVVTSALGLDSRIGRKYLRGALGYGGTCFPRDNIAFSFLLDQIGVSAELPRSVDRMNRRQVERVAGLAKSALGEKGFRVGVLGLAYKPATNVVEESQGIAIARSLVARGVEVLVYDPVAMDEARKVLNDSVTYADSIQQCLEQTGVLVIATPWPEFETAMLQKGNPSPKPIIIDGWRLLRPHPGRGAARYVGIGLGRPDGSNQTRLKEFVSRILGELSEGVNRSEKVRSHSSPEAGEGRRVSPG